MLNITEQNIIIISAILIGMVLLLIAFCYSNILTKLRNKHRKNEINILKNEIDLFFSWSANHFSPEDVIRNANKTEIDALKRILDTTKESPAQQITELRYAGSHTVAWLFRKLRGHEAEVSYDEIIIDVANKYKVTIKPNISYAETEALIVAASFKEILSNLKEAQRQELLEKIEAEAKYHGKEIKSVGTVTASIVAAQASGFGIYLMASTVVGACTHALGITLPFVFYTGMSQAIAVIIVPLGWTALAIWAIGKLSAPAYRKTVPAILLIAAIRSRLEQQRLDHIHELDVRKQWLEKHMELSR
ncbi:MAG: hypothetical protein JW841_00050 [Deltaproteobacteria bacterium]|nr:hypothetical protein [Deltaproteobacteria bacterium]